MRKIRDPWHRAFDVRPGEYLRTLFMSLYLMFVLFAYYILKLVSRSMFLNQFDIDKLPVLYIRIAGAGGLLAYFYTKLAVSASLSTAVNWAMGVSLACHVLVARRLQASLAVLRLQHLGQPVQHSAGFPRLAGGSQHLRPA